MRSLGGRAGGCEGCGWVASLDPDRLVARNIRGLVLDLDNTLVSEDDRWRSPGVEGWLRGLRDRGIRCFVLSNGRRRERFDAWLAYFSLEGRCHARKPLPRSFRIALQALGLPREQVAVVGDSWHTDGLGARWQRCRWIQVASLPHPPRWWERLAGRWVQRPYAIAESPPLVAIAPGDLPRSPFATPPHDGSVT